MSPSFSYNRPKDASKHSSSISVYFTRNSARPNAAAAQNSTNADTDDNDIPEHMMTNNAAATSTAEDGATLGKADLASVTAPSPYADVNVANNNDQLATTNNNAAARDNTKNMAGQNNNNGNNDVSNSVCQLRTTNNISHCIVVFFSCGAKHSC